ncbi:MAG: amidohydrolase [Chloroflexi bacterium]|nr:amidohydrolase [Chloroflexota bacterium]
MLDSSVEGLKRIACARIDQRGADLIALARAILASPETGFTEEKTSALVQGWFRELGIPYRAGLAITGVKGRMQGGAGPGPAVAIIGELDSLRVPDHPHADPATGAAHACGHHAQIAMMLGATVGLLAPEVLSHLSGAVVPFAVPAEELIEVERRLRLREEGRTELLGGKQELVRLGEFDDVDMAMMCHTSSNMSGKSVEVGGTSNGHVVKYVQFIGRGAHAGGSPHLGVNALNAAMLALSAIHANREAFQEKDTVRVHGIMTRGGEAVSAVPADVRLEWRVRSSNLEALVENSRRVDRCFKAGALAVGARVRIETIAGYLPMCNEPGLQEVFAANARELVGKGKVVVRSPDFTRGGSTDMGDLSHVVPSIHPYVAGATGTGHGKDYLVQDYEMAVLVPARAMAMTVIDLLADGARKAREVLAAARPLMDRQGYVAFQRERAGVVEFDGAAG